MTYRGNIYSRVLEGEPMKEYTTNLVQVSFRPQGSGCFSTSVVQGQERRVQGLGLFGLVCSYIRGRSMKRVARLMLHPSVLDYQ